VLVCASACVPKRPLVCTVLYLIHLQHGAVLYLRMYHSPSQNLGRPNARRNNGMLGWMHAREPTGREGNSSRPLGPFGKRAPHRIVVPTHRSRAPATLQAAILDTTLIDAHTGMGDHQEVPQAWNDGCNAVARQ
jgi:hypothetical protein